VGHAGYDERKAVVIRPHNSIQPPASRAPKIPKNLHANWISLARHSLEVFHRDVNKAIEYNAKVHMSKKKKTEDRRYIIDRWALYFLGADVVYLAGIQARLSEPVHVAYTGRPRDRVI